MASAVYSASGFVLSADFFAFFAPSSAVSKSFSTRRSVTGRYSAPPGLIFEQMCREYLFLYAEDVPVVLSDIGSWWGTDSKEKKEVEIDIVGTPVEGNEYIIGSCKYKNSPVGVDELELLKHYADVFGKGEKYHYYIFSKGGFTEGLQELADKSEVRLVTLQDMYK